MRANRAALGRLVLAAVCVFGVAVGGLSFAATSNDASVRATVVQRERAALEAFRSHDKKSYLTLCLPSFYEITSDGTVNSLQDELKELDDYVLGDYHMEDVVVTMPSPQVALIRYRIRARYSFWGKPLPVESMLASAVWIRTGGHWKAATYEEVRVAVNP